MVHSILAHKRKENKDMKDKIKDLTEKLKALEAEEVKITKHLAELKANNVEKTAVEQDGGIKLRQSKIRTFVSAKTARHIAETTSAFKNRVAKMIDETAKEGMTQVVYFVDDICDAQVNSVINELKGLNYEVELDDENKKLTIKW